MDPVKLVFFSVVAITVSFVFFLIKDRVQYFLFLTVAFAPLASGIIFYNYNGVMLMDFPLVILFAMLLAQGKIAGLPKGVLVPAIVWLGWSFLTSITAIEPGWAISEWTRHFRGFLLFLCVASIATTPKRIEGIIWGLLATLAFQALLGTYQWRYGRLGLSFLEERYFDWRAGGTYAHPSVYADYLILLMPMVFRFFVFLKSPNRWRFILYGLLLAFAVGGLYGSYARAEWISFACAMGLMLLYSVPKRRLRPRVKVPAMIMVAFATVFIIHYAPTITYQFVDKSRQHAADIRKPLNYIGLAMANAHPVFGVGLGNYYLELPRFVHFGLRSVEDNQFNYNDLNQIVHNSYLLLACETGWVGVGLWILFVFSVFWCGRKAVKINHLYLSNISISLLTGILAFSISITAQPNIMQHTNLMMVWMLAGFVIGLSRIRLAPPQPSAKPANSDAGMMPISTQVPRTI